MRTERAGPFKGLIERSFDRFRNSTIFRGLELNEATNDSGNRSVGFDLLHQPFSLLRIHAAASMAEIANAFEDALADGIAPESELLAARQAVTNPKQRLAAELSCLLDTPPGEAQAIYRALQGGVSERDLKTRAQRLSPLSRANMLAHVAAKYPSDTETFVGLVDAHAQLSVKSIAPAIARVRKAAGSPVPSSDQINEALHRLLTVHCRAAFQGYSDVSEAAETTNNCLKRIIPNATVEQMQVLDGLVESYAQFVSPELARFEDNLRRNCDALLNEPSNSDLFREISIAAHQWQRLAGPVMKLEAHKGRDDPRASALFLKLRETSLNLANDKSEHQTSLALTQLALETFNALPRASEQLKEDLAALKDLIEKEKLKPLLQEIEAAKTNIKEIVKELERHGFQPKSGNNVRKLYECFSSAVAATLRTTIVDLPWVIIRSFSLELNNDHNEPRAALAVTRGLLEHSQANAMSAHLLDQLREDRRAVEKLVLQADLLKNLQSGRNAKSAQIVTNLLGDCDSDEDRQTLVALQLKLTRERNSSYLKWGFWAFVVICIIIANLSERTNRTPVNYNYSRDESYAPRIPETKPSETYPHPPIVVETENPNELVEVKPQSADGSQFTRANIRYCVFQEERLDRLRELSDGERDTGAFNAMVEDWNHRCSKYRYLQRDMDAVKKQLVESRPTLASDAAVIASKWHSTGNALTNTDVSSGPPQSEKAQALTSSEAPESQVPLSMDLLNLDDTMRVQARLNELGYLKGKANGVWGPQSRRALLAFKVTNGLAADDSFDSTVAGKLLSYNAVRASSQGATTFRGEVSETTYPAQNGATLNPLNRADALKIHSKLRELGFYKGKNDTVWSGASRAALRDFKWKNNLGADDTWNGTIEQQLFQAVPETPKQDPREAFSLAIGGIWSVDTRACPGGDGGTNAIPLVISPTNAQAGKARCDFSDITGSDMNWTVRASCTVGDKTWDATINFSRTGESLKWSSEKGVSVYHRCEN